MRISVVYVLAALLALALGIGLIFPRVEGVFLQREQDAAEDTRRLVIEAIDQTIGRYEPLPQLVADDPVFQDLLRQSDNSGLVPFINEKLRLLAQSLGVSDIYIMDKSGLTIATSNYRREDSFFGKNFAYRPYFQIPLEGETTLFHALGTTSGERGFFFSAPILDGIEVVGVLAIKVPVDRIETAWTGSEREIIVADPNGVAFLSSRPEYRMRALAPLNDGQRKEIAMTRQYPLDLVAPLNLSASVISSGVVGVTVSAAEETRFLSISGPLDLAGWHAIVLTPFVPIRMRALAAVGVLALAITALALVGLLIYQRRASLLDRMRFEQEQRVILEDTVKARTADLDATNASLLMEVAERKSTEERLRKSQNELIQAGKLAALGKMSAALSHEINQPLGAVKSYAYNASRFLERGQTTEVAENISLISEMADRMVRISNHLRGFARQPGEKLRAIPIGDVVQKAIDLSTPQMRSSGVTVTFDPPQPEIFGIGGALRLQQVIVNMLTNAADAMADAPVKNVEIDVQDTGDAIRINLRDHGPGLEPEAMEQVFDAFYTTKEAGVGMGLGLSISFNIVEDFGGSMSVVNHPDGGAVFTVTLNRAVPMQEAAE